MRIKLLSSLEKCFLDETVLDKPALREITMLKNERYSFQICFDTVDKIDCTNKTFQIEIESPLQAYISMYKVQNVPSVFAYAEAWLPQRRGTDSGA